jgi:regulator of protease activity HflC (stomatin/prohibitin superfamily)
MQGLVIVPQQEAYVVERLGKFSRVLSPGLHFLIPLVDRIAYVHSLKEEAVNIPNQQAITMDNVTITIDGVLYLRVVDPMYASYGVSNMYYAMTQLAQTTMRSELGKMTLDKTFAERESLNAAIVRQINKAAEPWGIQCLRYEIRDILPPVSVKQAMDMQAEAERKKRATILDSEGQQQAEINIADGQRQSITLQAQGEAAAILTRAEATAKGIEQLAVAVRRSGGKEAVALKLAEQYVNAFGQLAKSTNTMLLPSNPGDPASMVASALSIYQNVMAKSPAGAEAAGGSFDAGQAAASPEGTAANQALMSQLLQQQQQQQQQSSDAYEKR